MLKTLDLPDDVLDRAERLAAKRKMTLGTLAGEGLRHVLSEHERDSTPGQVVPVVFNGNGLRAGLPTDFIENVRDWAYDDEP